MLPFFGGIVSLIVGNGVEGFPLRLRMYCQRSPERLIAARPRVFWILVKESEVALEFVKDRMMGLQQTTEQ